MTEPLRLSFPIACAPDHAFHVWTQRFSAWWPKGHTASGDPTAVVMIEPIEGGRIFERLPDGREIDWGEVTECDPPRRFAYTWHIRRERAEATDVELTFVDAGDGTTRLDIVQSGWDRLGDEAETWREANRGGWGGLIPNFAGACTDP